MSAAHEDDTAAAAAGDMPLTLADVEREATARMSAQARAYISGGAADEITLRDNVAAWGRLALCPRVLVGAGECDPAVELLGARRPHPLVIAPTAFQRLVHPDGEIGIAQGAAATGTIMCVSTLASTGVETVARAVPEVTRWFQIYAFTDRGVTRELIDRAADTGYEALVITVDRPVVGVRDREQRADVRVSADAAADAVATLGAGVRPVDYSALIDPALRWADVAQLAEHSRLPVLLKGILTPQDAQLAVAHGAAGIIVSNHGGRQLDTVLSGADALAPIAAAVDGRIDVLVDGGIRRGTDVVKALALGACAVMVGRPAAWGLAMGGAAGVRRVIEILLSEIVTALALTGCPRARDLDAGFVTHAPWVEPTL